MKFLKRFFKKETSVAKFPIMENSCDATGSCSDADIIDTCQRLTKAINNSKEKELKDLLHCSADIAHASMLSHSTDITFNRPDGSILLIVDSETSEISFPEETVERLHKYMINCMGIKADKVDCHMDRINNIINGKSIGYRKNKGGLISESLLAHKHDDSTRTLLGIK